MVSDRATLKIPEKPMRHTAPILLAGYGAGLTALTMPHPMMALGMATALLGILMMGVSLDLTLGGTRLPTLHLTREPGETRMPIFAAAIGSALGDAASFTATATILELTALAIVVCVLASLNLRLVRRTPDEIGI